MSPAAERVLQFAAEYQWWLYGLLGLLLLFYLRRAIAALLASHPEVREFKIADPQRGGGGASQVRLRK